MPNKCLNCDRTIYSDDYLCAGCAGRLAGVLYRADDVIGELRVTASRQKGIDYAAMADRVSGGDEPDSINSRAAELSGQLAAALTAWLARWPLDRLGYPVELRYAPAVPTALALAAVGAARLAAWPYAADCLAALEDGERVALRVIDPRGERAYAAEQREAQRRLELHRGDSRGPRPPWGRLAAALGSDGS